MSNSSENNQQMIKKIKTHPRRLFLLTFLVISITVSAFFFIRHQQYRNEAAQNEMFQAVYYFEQEEFEKALNGDDIFPGLLDIVKKYDGTQAAELAHFYVGVSYMHSQDYEKAIKHLSQFRTKDWLVRARAWVLLGDAYSEQGNHPLAASFYNKAANYRPNKSFTPHYLVKAALAFEASEDLEQALHCYEHIVQRFPEAPQYSDALKHAARLKTLVEQPISQ